MARKKTIAKKKTAKKKVTKRRVKPSLINASDESSFWTRDGRILYNLRDLRDALKKISKESFTYHVNKDKDDFCKWMEEVLYENKLAKSLKKVKTCKPYLKKIEAAVKKYR